jgi:hypothetical protein
LEELVVRLVNRGLARRHDWTALETTRARSK